LPRWQQGGELSSDDAIAGPTPEKVMMNEPAAGESVVVIDDDYAMRLSCKKILSKMGSRVEVFEDGAQGLEGVARLKPSLLVVDLKMPGISGLEVVTRVHESHPDVVIVVITGYATIDTAVEAMKCGAYDFLPKPFSPDELRLIVNRGLERRRLALESRRAEVEHALLKRRFITFVSHQLQTPLVANHQYLDVKKHLEDTPEAAAKRQEWFDRCLKRTEEMQALIKDWLTLARFERDSFARQKVKVDVQQVIADILKSYEEMAASNGVSLEAQICENTCYALGDRNCLSVLFDNLIGNAIKYNRPGGKVTVSAEARDGEITAAVADTGVGIPEKYRQLLFDEFFRVEGEGAKKAAGTGLGLSICRRIVAEMGGSISVESTVNVGSTFRVRLLAYREPAGEAENKGGSE
jgi:two-component system, sensor histidine kinase and response regulator